MTVLVALGAAALVLGGRSAWPSPLEEGPIHEGPTLGRLRAAAAAVDAACRTGDVEAFKARTTATHQRWLQRQLAVVDRQLDGRSIGELIADDAYGDLLLAEPLAGEVKDGRAVVAVPRPRGEGAQVMTFVWDGRRLQLDESTHSRAVTDARSARAAVDAVMRRER
ncbi:MAG: hypothetical protein H6835_20025 [Planctomycetes bacterium]|nr:hypothetical protein [Planctomycetota bacterium]MCB9885050.1 hypothetical protein [Planctomycetota bacterium]